MSVTQGSVEQSLAALSLHIGDMYVRAAWQDTANAPTNLEDPIELQRFTTPSLVSLDQGGALLGYQAQMAAAPHAGGPLLWRYSRAGLQDSTFVVRDAAGRGLTSAAFTALAARRLLDESSAWLTTTPDLVVVVPDKLNALDRLSVATLVRDATQHSVSICGEDQALVSQLGLAGEKTETGPVLVASFDDDALRLRILAHSGAALQRIAAKTDPGLGLLALRQMWVAQWNHDAAALMPDVKLFAHSASTDVEKIWQDIWQCLDADPRLKSRMPTWTVVRDSAVVPLALPKAAAEAQVEVFLADLSGKVEQVLATAGCSTQAVSKVVLIAPPGMGRLAKKALCTQIGINPACIRLADTSVYAHGAAKWYASTRQPGYEPLAVAPSKLGALGASKDEGALVLKPLIEAGTPLPASASFSIMANRDLQRRLAIKLAYQQSEVQPQLRLLTEFGPLQGQGMLRVKVNVVWDAHGRIHVTAADAETELALPVLDACDMVPSGSICGAAHVRQLA